MCVFMCACVSLCVCAACAKLVDALNLSANYGERERGRGGNSSVCSRVTIEF